MKKSVLFLALCFALLTVACRHMAEAPKSALGGAQLSGTISDLHTRQSVEGAFVYVYREGNTHFFGPPNYMSPASNAQGAFSMELPPGRYYIFARKRLSGSYQGPLYKDDYFGELQPELKDLGPGKTAVSLTLQKIEGQQFYRPEKFGVKTDTLVTGRILDQAGKPVLGGYVFAYRNAFRKREPPDYGSTSTDASGRYYLYLDKGGDFIIGARMIAKEPPETGEPLGFYRNDRQKTLNVATGSKMENVDIVLTPFAGTPEMKPAAIPFQTY